MRLLRAPVLWIPLFALLLFAPLVAQPTGVLYSDSSDLLAQYIPTKVFFVESFQETGEFPLWNPYHFAGTPFLHDIQVGMFYPPHWLLLLMPSSWVGAGLSWLIVAHLMLAGVGMYRYARSQELAPWCAVLAGVGFLSAGSWWMHLLGAGHYTTIGLAWLPWVLLCLERAIERGGLLAATGAGVFFALLILSTQPQWTLYALLFCVAWTFASATRSMRGYCHWLLCGIWMLALALALTAVQLLPTYEAAGLSTRSAGIPAPDLTTRFQEGLLTLLFLLGPNIGTDSINLHWENRGGFTWLWAVMALLAPLLLTGRVRYRAWVTLGLLLFACGGFALIQDLPVINLFRQHPRILLIAAFPIALLAATAVQHLCMEADAAVQQRVRWAMCRVLVVGFLLIGGYAMRRGLAEDKSLDFHPYWLTLLITIPGAWWLTSTGCHLAPQRRMQLWGVLLMVDVAALVMPLVAVRDFADIYRVSPSVAFLRAHLGSHRVLDRDVVIEGQPSKPSPLGAGAPLALMYRLPAVRGYNPLDVKRTKEYLNQVAGGKLPMEPFTGPLTFPLMGDFRIERPKLLDLLGVRYLLQPASAPLELPGWLKVFEDPAPQGLDLERGIMQLPAYAVYENPHVLPRAFVAFGALVPVRDDDLPMLVTPPRGGLHVLARRVTVRSETPNRVQLHLAEGDPGCLVLTNVRYPGWQFHSEGRTLPVGIRTERLSQVVEVSAAEQEVTCFFAPSSYRHGSWCSLVALTLVNLIFLQALLRWRSTRVRLAATR